MLPRNPASAGRSTLQGRPQGRNVQRQGSGPSGKSDSQTSHLNITWGLVRNEDFSETSLVVQWLRIHLAMEGTQVQSLVRELRSHRPWSY